MSNRGFRRLLGVASIAVAAVTLVAAASGSPGGRTLPPNASFYAPGPEPAATQQVAKLNSQGDRANANGITAMENTPRAVWLTGGSPSEVRVLVQQTVLQSQAKRQIPVFVAYDVPARDCSQYSAGGAATGAAYEAWIDSVARGLGSAKAVVLVEPDGLALLPTDCGQPDTYGRVLLISYAAHALLADPNASIYLDAGHSAWHSVGDMAARLAAAGVLDLSGFFLNASNYRLTSYETKFGTWISKCIAFANDAEEGGWRLGHYDWCASQYYSPFGPVDPNDISTWHYTDEWFDANLGHATPAAHFVIDTSRNGQGPWTAPSHPAGDPQEWCNPPGRGLGSRPTADTRVPLLDAYLWIKSPGESDGQCYRWTSGPLDPVRNMQDPAAGAWFPQMALELVQNAQPPLG